MLLAPATKADVLEPNSNREASSSNGNLGTVLTVQEEWLLMPEVTRGVVSPVGSLNKTRDSNCQQEYLKHAKFLHSTVHVILLRSTESGYQWSYHAILYKLHSRQLDHGRDQITLTAKNNSEDKTATAKATETNSL